MSNQSIPAGYRMDARQRLIPESMIKPVDMARDQLVMELVSKARAINEQLAKFKAEAFGDIEAFVDLSAEQYGVKKMGGKKGNVTLSSFDGRYRVSREVQEYIAFDERLKAAQALIEECLRDWTDGARPELAVLINDAFRTDSKGEIRTARVLALHRLQIEDDRWQRAMKAVSDACQVAGTKSYVRVYERVGESDQYRMISLDIAGV